MDERTRGYIEKSVDGLVDGIDDFLVDVEWVRDEVPISSFKELALGYTLGMIEAFGHGLSSLAHGRRESQEEMDEEIAEVRSMVRRRLPEIIERIERELGR